MYKIQSKVTKEYRQVKGDFTDWTYDINQATAFTFEQAKSIVNGAFNKSLIMVKEEN